MPVITQKNFQPDDNNIERGAYQKKYLFFEVFHNAKNKRINGSL